MENLFGKRVLITGINGFVGSHLAQRLESIGADVYGISRAIGKKDKVLKASILDYPSIEEFIKRTKIQIIFHLAGESLVETGQQDPYNTFKTNIEGTVNILEAGRKNSLEKIIIASTSHVYGKNKTPYLEEYAPRPSRPYETSKACMDLISESYATTYSLPVLIPRFVNIYGPGDLNFTRLIPKTIKSVLSGMPPKMWGGEALREYLFIDDAIEAYLKLANCDLDLVGENRIFNFGSGRKISVKTIIEKIINISKITLGIEKVKDGRDLEVNSQYVSSKKAESILKWKPSVGIDEGLKKTIDWYREYLQSKDE